MSLWTIANPECFRSVADRFGMGIGYAHREFINFCKQLQSIEAEYLTWPNGGYAHKVMDDFNNLRENNSFPDVFGCVDGKHIMIRAPPKERDSYFNRKGHHSILLQAVCDSNLCFIDIVAGSPGSCNDSRVWNLSPLGQQLKTNTSYLLSEGTHLIGWWKWIASISLDCTIQG